MKNRIIDDTFYFNRKTDDLREMGGLTGYFDLNAQTIFY